MIVLDFLPVEQIWVIKLDKFLPILLLIFFTILINSKIGLKQLGAS